MRDFVRFGNYVKLTLPHSCDPKMSPGQCAKVNGKWLAIASLRDEEFDVIVPYTSSLLSEEDLTVDLPQGKGFSDLDSSNALCIVGGTGLGAVIDFVNYRIRKNLPTKVQMYGRHVVYDDVVSAFPVLKDVEFKTWNTSVFGRPIMNDVLPQDETVPIFFAGPKDFFEALKVNAKQKIILNF